MSSELELNDALLDLPQPNSESSTFTTMPGDHSISNTNLSSYTVCPPIIRSVDKPSSSIPRTVTVSEDYLRASVGFRKIDSMKQHFHSLYQDTIKIDRKSVV